MKRDVVWTQLTLSGERSWQQLGAQSPEVQHTSLSKILLFVLPNQRFEKPKEL